MWLPPSGSVAVCWMLPSTKTAMSVRAAADVGEDDALALLLRLEHRLSARQRRRDQALDLHAGALDTLRRVLEHRAQAGDDVRLDIEALAEHAQRVRDAVLPIDDVVARHRRG